MCIKPVKIYNRFCNTVHYRSEQGCVIEVPQHLFSHSRYIDVPCGKCAECRNTYIESIYQRAYVESQSSYVYFVTLTYDNEHLPVVVLPSGKKIYYSCYDDIQSMFDRFRKKFSREYRYLCVNEYGDTNYRPHFHILLFVAKHSNDTKSTPLFIESEIFSTLGKYFSKNVGTRKLPKYESLFTYHYKMVNGKLYSNYFVKYVDPYTSNSVVANSKDSSIISKTIRYLIMYVNKGSSIHPDLLSELESIEDVHLRKKYKYLLSCSVRYSKGFGNGFYEGKKLSIPIISQRISQLDYIYSNIVSTLTTYDELSENDKIMLQDFVTWPPYGRYSSIQDFCKDVTDSELYYHFVLLILLPDEFNRLYRFYFRTIEPYISYFYRFLNPSKYCKKLVKTFDFEYTPTYDIIRKGIDLGIQSKLPFIAFCDFSTNTFYSLCQYYKQRFSTLFDFDNMLKSCGFSCYDDWIDAFTKYVRYNKVDKALGNKSLPREFLQRNCQSDNLLQDVYNYFFSV